MTEITQNNNAGTQDPKGSDNLLHQNNSDRQNNSERQNNSAGQNQSSNQSKIIAGIKGMPDILPKDTPQWAEFESRWRQLMKLYGYEEIRLPILEATRLFKRSIGEVTDIVEKEMFTFSDRDAQSLSMRPEGTAGCVRACLEHGLLHNQEQRLWYQGPMFRYEKPQKGRFRQFHQVGVEAFGYSGPDVDAEHILMMARFWRWLGIENHIELQINTLGSADARQKYRSKLVEYFSKYWDKLDEDSRRRLNSNPLRILDSKNPELQDIINQAPECYEDLSIEDKTHFEAFEQRLKAADIKYTINPRLVRGLDYYNRTVYEWVTDTLGAQGTVCAGGRYDALVEQLGGRPTPAVGFALGIERVLMVQQTQGVLSSPKADVYFVCVGNEAEKEAMNFIERLRDKFPHLKFMLHCGGGSFKNQFKRGDKSGAELALILGENELATNTLGIKFLRGIGEEAQATIAKEKVFSVIADHFKVKDE